MNPYEAYVQKLSDLIAEARQAPLGGFPDYPRPEPDADAPVALIFSPHPDDEVIIGGWALRLLRQTRWRVVNVAVTQGSNRQRQQGRWDELTRCCRCIGFELQATQPNGLEGVNVKTRTELPDRWRDMTKIVGAILSQHRPRAIFFPHETDWNSTHIGTHYLVADALAGLPGDFRCAAVETEFWGQMPRPNVLVESSAADVAALITALSWHVEEVQRNPYHLTVPAWMMDNVRRGGEWIGGQGRAVPSFLFGTMYRVRNWRRGRFEEVAVPAGFLDAGRDPAEPFGRLD
jgi:LmbE family N-acetylglucosaminyl deacetylase